MQKQNQNSDPIQAGLDRVKSLFTGEDDIISVIKEDHKPLKEFIKDMKDSEKPLAERVQAFQEFAPLLMTHAKAEEKSLYDFMKTKAPLSEEAFEGDTEHGLADQMVEEIKRTTDKNQLGAKIKVLAELVEHHIEEEESSLLPDVKSKLDEKTLKQLCQKYSKIQGKIISEGQDDAPAEASIRKDEISH